MYVNCLVQFTTPSRSNLFCSRQFSVASSNECVRAMNARIVRTCQSNCGWCVYGYSSIFRNGISFCCSRCENTNGENHSKWCEARWIRADQGVQSRQGARCTRADQGAHSRVSSSSALVTISDTDAENMIPRSPRSRSPRRPPSTISLLDLMLLRLVGDSKETWLDILTLRGSILKKPTTYAQPTLVVWGTARTWMREHDRVRSLPSEQVFSCHAVDCRGCRNFHRGGADAEVQLHILNQIATARVIKEVLTSWYQHPQWHHIGLCCDYGKYRSRATAGVIKHLIGQVAIYSVRDDAWS